jgi:VanZ family protein
MKKLNREIILLICFIFLATTTAGTAWTIKRYKQNGSDLLGRSWQTSGPESVHNGTDDTILHLASRDAKSSVRAWQEIGGWGDNGRLGLEAAMKWEDVKAGKNSWNMARLVLFQFNGAGGRIEMPHVVAAVDGTGSWQTFQKVFEISPFARKLKVEAHLSNCTGEMWISRAALFGVSQTPLYTWAVRMVLSLWGVFFMFLLVVCIAEIKKPQFWLKALLAAAFLAVIAGTTMPNYAKNQLKCEIENKIHAVGKNTGTDKLISMMDLDITKIGHFALFGAAGLLLVILLPGGRLYTIFAILMMLAAGTELIQFFIDGRSPLIGDFTIDAAGSFMGAATGLLKK